LCFQQIPFRPHIPSYSRRIQGHSTFPLTVQLCRRSSLNDFHSRVLYLAFGPRATLPHLGQGLFS
jgi:hypothetical protein